MFITFKKCIGITTILLISHAAQAKTQPHQVAWQQQTQLKQLTEHRCLAPSTQEKILSMQDFSWNLSAKENLDRQAKIYQSGKRLPYRAYFDQNKGNFVIPFNMSGDSSKVKISDEFISSVQNHIEDGLKNKYSEAITFSDMGHSHLYLPKKHWDEEYIAFVRDNTVPAIYEKMLADPKLQVLYHTAEQLQLKVDGKLVDDKWLKWRYHSRNVIGGMGAQHRLRVLLLARDDQHYNTVRKIDGFHRWSAGFNISVSNQGCFSFTVNGEKRYFDISLMNMPYSADDYEISPAARPRLAKVSSK